ncbi:MAG TPA: hypothetical protein VD929_06850 [Caulobacteraceae bacterium]|nr:hypothetical protein [Caulobacteraceae bacterium]
MRVFVIATTIAALAAPALAQSGQAAGLRYLDWPGKTAKTATSKPAPPPLPFVGRADQAKPVAGGQIAATPPPSPAPPAVLPDRGEGEAKPLQSVEGARRYSLHREFGQEPDRPQLPPEFFLNDLPVDLAEPPAQPLRDRDERRRAAADPDSPQE